MTVDDNLEITIVGADWFGDGLFRGYILCCTIWVVEIFWEMVKETNPS